MKYIRNKNSYDMSLKIKDKEGNEVIYDFPCFKRYSDTGNVVSSGITVLDDGDFALLKKNKQFNKLLTSREFEYASKEDLTESVNELEIAQKEKEKLQAENAELKKQVAKASSEDLKKALAENAELKKQLEILGNSTKQTKPANKENSKNADKAGDTGDTGGF